MGGERIAKKITPQIFLVEIKVPMAWSPPSGPDATLRVSSRPVFLNKRLPVVPVAIN
ncbi:hypothetical protein SynA18461_02755 [Synechococcus sp. A18-46.1]|nr:hypothetical protein SynA18461_02755 [Synechococcus sp. A18-46.1]